MCCVGPWFRSAPIRLHRRDGRLTSPQQRIVSPPGKFDANSPHRHSPYGGDRPRDCSASPALGRRGARHRLEFVRRPFYGRGQANALTRATAVLAGIFFATSISLTLIASFGRAPNRFSRGSRLRQPAKRSPRPPAPAAACSTISSAFRTAHRPMRRPSRRLRKRRVRGESRMAFQEPGHPGSSFLGTARRW